MSTFDISTQHKISVALLNEFNFVYISWILWTLCIYTEAIATVFLFASKQRECKRWR